MSIENTAPAQDTGSPAPETQVDEKVETSTPENANPSESSDKGAKPAATKSPDKSVRLHEILAKIDKNPNETLSDADLEIYMEYDDGKGKLKPKAPQPASKKEDKEDSEPESEATDTETEKKAPEKKKDDLELSPHVTDAMKEVGAKTPEELTAKIKELRAKVSGKETETVTRLKQEHDQKLTTLHQNETALWRDFVAGKPEAIAHVNAAYGISPSNPVAKAQPETQSEITIDPDVDALTGGLLSKLFDHNKALGKRLDEIGSGLESQKKQVQESGIRQTVAAKLVDDMIAVSANLESLKGIPDLRNRIIDRVVNRKADPALDAFNELFQIAEEHNTDLPTAHLILQGRKLPMMIEAAKEQGRKEAYKHVPNRSLSGVVTEDATPQSITAEQIKRMETDPTAIPSEWFDAHGNLVQSKVPKKAWAAFGFE